MPPDTQATQPSARPGEAAPTIPAGPSSDALELIAQGVTDLAGFGIAAISVVRDDGRLELIAIAGDDDAAQSVRGRRTPVASLMKELEKADDWGLLKFIPHERLDLGTGEEAWGWVPDPDFLAPTDGPDAWHPLDMLVAPLYDDKGDLRGTLAMDLPRDGRRPGAQQRQVLQTYAEQAGRAVVTALEREALAEQVRLAEAARAIVRNASAQLSMDRILADSQEALVEGFQARGMWLQTFDEDGQGTGAIYSSDGTKVELPDELVTVAERSARRAWSLQRAEIVCRDRPFGPTITAEQGDGILLFLESIGITSILFTPLGAGPECLGNLVLTRAAGQRDWTEHEAAAALDIGHDLGRAILNARTFEREHHLVEELQALDTYKSQLIATVSHELKNPLTAITGHLEILEGSPDLSGAVQASLKAMDRGARRLGKVIDDLLLLSKVGDPHYPLIAVPVDVRRTLEEVLDLSSLAAERKGLTFVVEAPGSTVVASGDPDELDRVLTNLVSNAVKYTPAGRTITLSLETSGDGVVFRCADQGIGISEADRTQLFREFFRSTNPQAVAEPGTGLGLAIVKRIVERHHSRIDVFSELGRGSTFTVTVPAA